MALIADNLVARLARACAHGTTQMGLVNELLARPVVKGYRHVGGNAYVVYGEVKLGGQSFRNLRRRLHAVGFILTTTPVDHETALVSLSFPERSA